MKDPIQKYFQVGTIQWMTHPPVNYPILDSVKTICCDEYFNALEITQTGHPGGSLSCTEILTSLYFEIMNVNPEDPEMEGRDHLILSKGHAAPMLYLVLAEKGFFPKEELKTLRQMDSMLQGHPCVHKTPGVELSTGCLLYTSPSPRD